jgi:hypothetical protein
MRNLPLRSLSLDPPLLHLLWHVLPVLRSVLRCVL